MSHFLQGVTAQSDHHPLAKKFQYNNFMNELDNFPSYLLCITGPTASGKTNLSLKIIERLAQLSLSAEIINVDVGQFYVPLSIGTAKPANLDFSKNHLFDIVSEPKNFDVVLYQEMVMKKVSELWAKKKIPILVGGSLFYIKSLFFSLNTDYLQNNSLDQDSSSQDSSDRDSSDRDSSDRDSLDRDSLDQDSLDQDSSWDQLKKIDPIRASQIHPNDIYRIERALAIWKKTGQKPSSLQPKFVPQFHSRVIFIDTSRKKLFEKINTRTNRMMEEGWIDEAKKLYNTPWQNFLKEKKIIGYPEIFCWIEKGCLHNDFPTLVSLIQQKTRNYAKRQITFWKKFRTLLQGKSFSDFICFVQEIQNVSSETVDEIMMQVLKDLKILKWVQDKKHKKERL